jgi:hypothetical protein
MSGSSGDAGALDRIIDELLHTSHRVCDLLQLGAYTKLVRCAGVAPAQQAGNEEKVVCDHRTFSARTSGMPRADRADVITASTRLSLCCRARITFSSIWLDTKS